MNATKLEVVRLNDEVERLNDIQAEMKVTKLDVVRLNDEVASLNYIEAGLNLTKLKVTNLNRVITSLYAIAQSLDESLFRELRLENIAMNSKAIGQVITQSAEFSIPILNTWYNISSSARGFHRNSLSTKDIYDQVEGNTMFKKPNIFQAVYYYTRAFFQN
jgi:hypothetical protein